MDLFDQLQVTQLQVSSVDCHAVSLATFMASLKVDTLHRADANSDMAFGIQSKAILHFGGKGGFE